MSEGFILLHRKLLEWGWYNDINVKVLFLHCLLRANYSNAVWMGQIVERGSFITSIDGLSKETGLSTKQVRVALSKLIKTGEVGKQTTSYNTLITVISYDSYQHKGKQRANEGQTKGKQRATDKEEKQNNNILSTAFDGFWKFYDKKSDRKKCFEKWMQVVNIDNIDHVRSSVKIYVAETANDKQFRKNPLTWLNGNCWLDYPIGAKAELPRINDSLEAN